LCKCTNTVKLFAVKYCAGGPVLECLGLKSWSLTEGPRPLCSGAVGGGGAGEGRLPAHDSRACVARGRWSWEPWIAPALPDATFLELELNDVSTRDTLFLSFLFFFFFFELKLGKTSAQKSNSGKTPTEENKSSVFSSCPMPHLWLPG